MTELKPHEYKIVNKEKGHSICILSSAEGHPDLPSSTLKYWKNREDVEIVELFTRGQIDALLKEKELLEAFYKLTISERNYERNKVDNLAAEITKLGKVILRLHWLYMDKRVQDAILGKTENDFETCRCISLEMDEAIDKQIAEENKYHEKN